MLPKPALSLDEILFPDAKTDTIPAFLQDFAISLNQVLSSFVPPQELFITSTFCSKSHCAAAKRLEVSPPLSSKALAEINFAPGATPI